ncbi:hypothetical protein D3C85_1719490 [compost metagenome]
MLYFTSIFPFLPGKIAALGFVTTIVLSVDWAEIIVKGASPVFVNSKDLTALSLFEIFP